MHCWLLYFFPEVFSCSRRRAFCQTLPRASAMGKRGPAGAAAAPKQKAGKAAAKAAAAAVLAAGSPEALALALPLQHSSVNTQALTLNGKIWATHLENIRVFKEQAVSEDLVQMKPLDRSFAQVFEEKAALESLKRDGSTCAWSTSCGLTRLGHRHPRFRSTKAQSSRSRLTGLHSHAAWNRSRSRLASWSKRWIARPSPPKARGRDSAQKRAFWRSLKLQALKRPRLPRVLLTYFCSSGSTTVWPAQCWSEWSLTWMKWNGLPSNCVRIWRSCLSCKGPRLSASLMWCRSGTPWAFPTLRRAWSSSIAARSSWARSRRKSPKDRLRNIVWICSCYILPIFFTWYRAWNETNLHVDF